MKTNKVLALQIADMALDPLTWLCGVCCLAIAGFHQSRFCGFLVLGCCLLATPVAPKLLRCLIGRLPESRNR